MAQTGAYIANTNKFIQRADTFMDKKMRIQNNEVSLKTLKIVVGQMTQQMKSKTIGGLPSDTEVATIGPHEQYKAISTRSGLQLKDPEIPAQTIGKTNETVAPKEATDETSNAKEPADAAITAPQIRFRCDEMIEDLRLPPLM